MKKTTRETRETEQKPENGEFFAKESSAYSAAENKSRNAAKERELK